MVSVAALMVLGSPAHNQDLKYVLVHLETVPQEVEALVKQRTRVSEYETTVSTNSSEA